MNSFSSQLTLLLRYFIRFQKIIIASVSGRAHCTGNNKKYNIFHWGWNLTSTLLLIASSSYRFSWNNCRCFRRIFSSDRNFNNTALKRVRKEIIYNSYFVSSGAFVNTLIYFSFVTPFLFFISVFIGILACASVTHPHIYKWEHFSGLYLYMLVVETFSGDNLKFKLYALIGWGK